MVFWRNLFNMQTNYELQKLKVLIIILERMVFFICASLPATASYPIRFEEGGRTTLFDHKNSRLTLFRTGYDMLGIVGTEGSFRPFLSLKSRKKNKLERQTANDV